MSEFTIVIEDAGANYAAYAPDVPGGLATKASVAEVTSTSRGATAEHSKILRGTGEEDPVPHSHAAVIQAA